MLSLPKAVALGEALKPEFKEYAKQIIANCQALAEGLIAEGFRLVSGGTDNHLLLVDVRGQKMTGKTAEHLLDEIGVTCNKILFRLTLKARLLPAVSVLALLP